MVALALDEGLKRSRCGVVVVSPAALERPWVLEEYAAMVSATVSRGMRLVPVLYREAESVMTRSTLSGSMVCTDFELCVPRSMSSSAIASMANGLTWDGSEPADCTRTASPKMSRASPSAIWARRCGPSCSPSGRRQARRARRPDRGQGAPPSSRGSTGPPSDVPR